MSLVFTRDFDLELAREDHEARRAAYLCHTAEDLARAVTAARLAAFDEGRQAGHAEGLAAAADADHARSAAAIETLVPQVTALIDAADTHRAVLETQLLDFAYAVCEQVFPELLRLRAHDRTLAQLRRALALGLGSASLRVSLPPEALRLLQGDLAEMITGAGLAGRVEMRADPALRPGDLRVDWDSGCLDYSFSAICDRILCALRDARDSTSAHLLER